MGFGATGQAIASVAGGMIGGFGGGFGGMRGAQRYNAWRSPAPSAQSRAWQGQGDYPGVDFASPA